MDMALNAFMFLVVWLGGATIAAKIIAPMGYLIAVAFNAVQAFLLYFIWKYRVNAEPYDWRKLLVDFVVILVVSFPVMFIARLLW